MRADQCGSVLRGNVRLDERELDVPGGSELLEDDRRELDDTEDFDEDDDLPDADGCELEDAITLECGPDTDAMATPVGEETPEIDEVLGVDGEEEPEVDDDIEEIEGVGVGSCTFMLALDAARPSGPQMHS